MGFVEAVKAFYRNYVKFDGRSSRSEYWWVALFQGIVTLLLLIPAFGGMMAEIQAAVDAGVEPSMMSMFGPGMIPLAIFALINFIPGISLMVRRFHDRGQTGWLTLAYYVCAFIPFVSLIAGIALIVNFCMAGTAGPNKYGSDPLGHNVDTFS